MTRTAIILTTYNRPTLVADAIASVREQSDPDWRLYIMDDGCDEESRGAIRVALAGEPISIIPGTARLYHADGRPLGTDAKWERVVWWQGPDRTPEERVVTIPYSVSINLALNCLLSDERYVGYLCDDDYLMPDAIKGRADYLDAHPEIGAVYGRLRSIRYGADGSRNVWKGDMGRPEAGRHWVEPDGDREFYDSGSARHYYRGDGTDPDTGFNYVEEGFWLPGPLYYGHPHAIDHNQILHRVSLLTGEPQWMWEKVARQAGDARLTYTRYWPEVRAQYPVGDAPFFARLAQHGFFWGVDVWTVTKRYSAMSDGVSQATRRE